MADTDVTAKPPSTGRLSRWMFAALLLVAVGFVVRSLAPQTIGETARRKFLSQLQQHYDGYSVSIRRGHFDPELGLIFEDLRIVDSRKQTSPVGGPEMIRIDRIIVMGDFHAENLLNRDNPIVTRRVLVEGVTANAWVQEDGQVSLANLMPMPKFGPCAPQVDLHHVKLHLHGDPRQRPIDAEFRAIDLHTSLGTDGTATTELSVRGSGEFANDLLAKIVTKNNAIDVRCAARGIQLTPSLMDRLPTQWASSLRHVKGLSGVCDATLALQQTADGRIQYQVRATVQDGRFAHECLPQPLTEIRGVVVVDPDGVTIEAGQAMLGDAFLRADGRMHGHQWPCDVEATVSTRGLLLDDRISAALPLSMQQQWSKLQPIGRIDIDSKLEHRSGVWKSDADLICKGVDVRYEKFPYPVEQLVGRVKIRDGIVSADGLSGRIGGNRMQCAFRMPIRPGITSQKSFVVATDGPVPIDNTLLRSLSPRGQSTTRMETFIRSLRPRGSVRLASAMFATDADGRKTRKIDLRVIDGHLTYEKFAYPLYNVSGTIKVVDDRVDLVQFRGTNANAGVILCDGTYQLPPGETLPIANSRAGAQPIITKLSDQSRLDLHFQASNVPMDESLRSSLPISTAQVWESISPSGVLDELNVDLTQRGSGNPLDIEIVARQHEHGQVTNRLLSLRPASLPYRLDVTGGTVRFDGSRVTIESITGQHDASRLSADGMCVQGADGRWELALNLHSGSRLHPDAELIASLPPQMREAMRRLQLRGPVNVRGTARIAMPDRRHPEPIIDWDLVLQLEGNRIGDVGPVHSIRGELSVQGMRDEHVLQAEGDVHIDSMHVYGLQVAAIRGPFSIDGDRLYLGSQSASRKIPPASGQRLSSSLPGLQEDSSPSKANPSIRGKLFDGSIDLDGEVVLTSGGFNVGLAVRDAQVPTLLADFGHGEYELKGTFSGQSRLQGNLGSMDLLRGNGAAKVTGANLYQLPMIVQVLNLLRVTPTEDVAFTDGEMEFTLFGETVTFSDLQMWGDLVSLQGGGTLDRRRELDLTFNTRVSPQNTFTRVVRPLRSRRYTLWTIDVRGPLNAPEIERRALDGVGETLERIFPAMGKSEADRDGGKEPATANRLGGWLK